MKKWKADAECLCCGLCIAVSMYSRIPMPKVEWKRDNLRFVLCFFPLVGVVVGAAELVWWHLTEILDCGVLMKGGLGAVLPLLITGGIHMDGFMDTSDALCSYGSRDKKLEILKDAHLGAFAVIRFGVYLLLYAGFYSELCSQKEIYLVAMGYLMSRAWSAVGFVTLKKAKNSGMLYEFAEAAEKRAVLISSGLVICLLSAGGICLAPITGILMVLLFVLVFCQYKRLAYREFGGITGDVAGYFLQQSELLLLLMVVIMGYIR